MLLEVAIVDDTEARTAVRELIKRFDVISAQGLGLAYVLARRDAGGYARLLESADRAVRLVVQPMANVDGVHREIFAALDDPKADWPKAVFAVLNQEAVFLNGDQAVERMKFNQELDVRFDAEDGEANKDERE